MLIILRRAAWAWVLIPPPTPVRQVTNTNVWYRRSKNRARAANPPPSPSHTPDKASLTKLKESLDLKLTLHDGMAPVGGMVKTPDIEITGSPGARSTTSSTSTSGPDSGSASPGTHPAVPVGSQLPDPGIPRGCWGDYSRPNSEAFACTMNLSFPANSVTYCQSPVGTPKSAKDQLCGVFLRWSR